MSMSVSLQVTIHNPTVRPSILTRRSSASFVPTANNNRRSGVDVGGVRAKLPDQASHRHDPVQVCPRIPATDVSLVRRAHQTTLNYGMAAMQ